MQTVISPLAKYGYGQRITIVIVLPRKNIRKKAYLKSGWMIYPDGVIQLATPYCGEIEE